VGWTDECSVPVCHALVMFDDLLDENRRFAAGFGGAAIPARAAKGLALVTCMDTRMDPLPVLGLRPGDAKIIRNAGGRVTPDALRSLILATRMLGVRRIAVMQHTDCALAFTTDDDIRHALGVPDAADWEFLAMADPDADLRRDVDAVRSCPLLAPGVTVVGWRYDVKTGLVERVIEPVGGDSSGPPGG
jgi:carbonic anhydrase